MKAKRKFATILGIVALATMFVSTANAACGSQGQFKQQSWDGASSPASLLQVNFPFFNEPIVGMWHVTFTAKGNTGAMAPPDGAPIDNSMVVFHSDGTEIMESDRPPQDGQICLGVWEQTGKGKYKVNHMPWLANDTTNAPSGIGNPTGPVQLMEEITLSPDRQHYKGTFTLDAYDLSGNQIAHIVGVLAGTRLNIKTKVKDLL
jgi:hypothetical protein